MTRLSHLRLGRRARLGQARGMAGASGSRLLVVCGLGREAAVLTGPGIEAVYGGGVRAVLEGRLATVEGRGVAAVVSFGLAGALAPGLTAGDLLCPAATISPHGTRYPAAPALLQTWQAGLSDLIRPGALLAGVDRPLLSPADKSRVRAGTGADAVDMESDVAAAFAASRGLPFGMIRVVSDGADVALPPIAGRAMRPDGSVDVLGVLAGLARAPGQIPALIRTARDAGAAFRTLGRVRGLLGPRLGLDL